MIIVFDGPEKAGKTTLINALADELRSRGNNVKIRHWGPVDPDDRVYTPALQEDALSEDVITLWDRSWASEYVYSTLLDRDRRLNGDAFLGEWLHARAVHTVGFHVVVLAGAPDLREHRDETDLPVDPYRELSLFTNYGATFQWRQVFNGYNDFSLRSNVDTLTAWIVAKQMAMAGNDWRPPRFAGPPYSPVLIVGKGHSARDKSMPGGWLPFTGRLTTNLGREIGPNAIRCAWTNLEDLTDDMLWGRQMVVFCGKGFDWPEVHGDNTVVLNVPHPAHTYRAGIDPYVIVNGKRESPRSIRDWVADALIFFSHIKEAIV